METNRPLSAILTDSSKWCINAFARNAHGHPVPIDASTAAQFCLLGANGLAAKRNPAKPEQQSDMRVKLSNAVSKLFPNRAGMVNGYFSLNDFNDHTETTFEDVQAVLEEAGL